MTIAPANTSIAANVPKRNAYYRSLDSDGIIRTITALHERINRKFNDSGLSNVAAELLEVSREAAARAVSTRRPNIPLRIAVALLLALAVAVIGWLLTNLRVNSAITTLPDLLQSFEAGVNILLLAGAAIWSLISLEVRVKRTGALQMIHELRVLAHLVDMHQLTKDPERLFDDEACAQPLPGNPMSTIELARYLDYCTEMLSLIGKIAALYAQYFDDRVVLQAVDEVEDLSNSLSRKIWQKIMILYQCGQIESVSSK